MVGVIVRIFEEALERTDEDTRCIYRFSAHRQCSLKIADLIPEGPWRAWPRSELHGVAWTDARLPRFPQRRCHYSTFGTHGRKRGSQG